MAKRVLVPIAPGFEEIEAITVIDLLRRANLTVVLATLDGSESVTGSHEVTVRVETSLKQIENESFDAIVLPGGMPGASHLAENETLKRMLKDQAGKGNLIGAICAAPMVLAKHGLLNGVRATAYPSFQSRLQGAHVVADEKVVEDRNFITSQGPATAIPFALAVISKLVGQAIADDVCQGILAQG